MPLSSYAVRPVSASASMLIPPSLPWNPLEMSGYVPLSSYAVRPESAAGSILISDPLPWNPVEISGVVPHDLYYSTDADKYAADE